MSEKNEPQEVEIEGVSRVIWQIIIAALVLAVIASLMLLTAEVSEVNDYLNVKYGGICE